MHVLWKQANSVISSVYTRCEAVTRRKRPALLLFVLLLTEFIRSLWKKQELSKTCKGGWHFKKKQAVWPFPKAHLSLNDCHFSSCFFSPVFVENQLEWTGPSALQRWMRDTEDLTVYKRERSETQDTGVVWSVCTEAFFFVVPLSFLQFTKMSS